VYLGYLLEIRLVVLLIGDVQCEKQKNSIQKMEKGSGTVDFHSVGVEGTTGREDNNTEKTIHINEKDVQDTDVFNEDTCR
jgi:hypothetical protein